MPYVSCMLAPPHALDPEVKAEGQRNILCTDENGVVWSLTEDSQVGDWLRYKEAGGTVEPYVEPEEDPEGAPV